MPECVPDQTTYTHDQLLAIYSPNGVLSDVLADAGPDSTGHFPIAALQQRLNDMVSAGTLPAVLPPGTISQGDIEAQIVKDQALFKSLEKEYCFYQSRYQYAFREFTTLATSRVQTDNAAARQALNDSVILNQRVNFILEMTNYLAQQRAPVASAESATINSANASINAKLQALQKTYNLLKQDNAIVAVQREMVNYTNSKNQTTAGTVTMWVAINILALGAIGYVYTKF
jgi:hypothetical protein